MKKVWYTPHAPAPIGPYSQAVESNGMLYVSGQIPLNPSTGELEQGGIEAETHQVMANIRAILESGGLGFDNIVKSSIFLKSMDDFPVVNAAYGTYFTQDPPARETVQVAKLPKDVNIEISVIAFIG